jgi:hypothetical protein
MGNHWEHCVVANTVQDLLGVMNMLSVASLNVLQWYHVGN